MANILYIPDLNPVRFYEATPAVFDEYLTKYFDSYPFKQQIYPWQQRTCYCQKFQTSDTIKIQLTSDFDPLQIDLVNQYGDPVTTLIGNLTLPNIYIPGMFAREFTLSLAGVTPGVYHLQLTNGNPAELNMISEPISVAVTHPNTKLFQYRNSRFHGDVVFETGIRFEFRVECSFDFLDPKADLVLYKNQKNSPQLLSARPYRVWPLVFGGSRGIPDWAVDKIHLIFCVNDVLIDGRPFARNDEEADVAFNTVENYPMRAMTLQLTEGINRQSKIVSPTIDTTKKLVVVYQIDTKLFGDTSSNAGSNLVPILNTD